MFFPSFYEEFFSHWPPAPTAEELNASGGDTPIATAVARKAEETVSGFSSKLDQ